MRRCDRNGLRTTAWVGTITRKEGLVALVAGLLGGCRARCGSRDLSATAGGAVGKRLFVGVTFIDAGGREGR